MFRVLKKDVEGVKSTKVEGEIVTVNHTTVHPKLAPSKSGERIQMTWQMDFEDVTREELMELASKSLTITFRGPFKALDEPDPKDWDTASFNIRNWIDDQKRKPVDKVAAAKKMFDGLSEEQTAALLAALLPADEQE